MTVTKRKNVDYLDGSVDETFLQTHEVDDFKKLDDDETRFWTDVLWLAEEFKSEIDVSRKTVLWHHLLLAVGNFKRQGGTKIFPTGIADLPQEVQSGDCKEIVIPGGFPKAADGVLGIDSPQTWKDLETIRGLGVATTTTVLSALWPGQHFVLDVRALRAATALASIRASCLALDLDAAIVVDVNWRSYIWYRDVVLSTGRCLNIDGTDIERALYNVDRKIAKESSKIDAMTWMEYIACLKKMLPDA